MKKLEDKGYLVEYIDVDDKGIVDLDDLKRKVNQDTALISIMHVNNDIGTIQPIEKIVTITRVFKNIKLHSDGVQAEASLFPDLKNLGVDSYNFSAHKFHGSKGVSVIFLKDNKDEIGELEKGTANTPLIVGMAEALKNAYRRFKDDHSKLVKLSSILIKRILNEIEDVILIGDVKQKVPNITSFAFKGIHRDMLVHSLDENGFAVSVGAACASKDVESSHVLRAIGVNKEYINGSLRISLSKYNSENEISLLIEALKALLMKRRGY